jgi:hypothetical protein
MFVILGDLSGLWQFIYNYQTLLTGAAALAAAYIAARPVWKQLKLTQTQAEGVLRDMLLQRQAEVDNAYAALAHQVGKPLNDLSADLLWPDGEAVRLDEHQAFNHAQAIWSAISSQRADTEHRNSATVEATKGRLIELVDALHSVLDHIHRPASTNQHDEDHDFSDEEWAAIEARGEAAKDEVQDALVPAQNALSETFKALELEKEAIKGRLKKLDEALLAGS